jgi:hypothetical protein
LLAVYVAFVLPQRRRRGERIANLREQGAQVVEPVRNLLLDLEALRAGDIEAAEALSRRWREDLRDPLVAWGMGQGSSEVSQLSLRVRDAVGEALNMYREGVSIVDHLLFARELVQQMREAIGVDVSVRTGGPAYRTPNAWR